MYNAECFWKVVCVWGGGGGRGGGVSANEGRILCWGAPTLKIVLSLLGLISGIYSIHIRGVHYLLRVHLIDD